MRSTETLLFFLTFTALAVLLLFWQFSRADEILQRWATANGFKVISAEKRFLRTGPFFLRSTRGQFVFRIVVEDQSGTKRTGWLRVGGWMAGVLSDKAKVIWD